MHMVQNSVKKRAGFDISTVKPIAHVDHCFIPALFGVASDDELVPPAHHGEPLYAKYAGDKNIIHFTGGHNGERPQSFLDTAAKFMQTVLYPPELV
jgi:hypothetical protein